jgi:hypothetical protein
MSLVFRCRSPPLAGPLLARICCSTWTVLIDRAGEVHITPPALEQGEPHVPHDAGYHSIL